MALAMSTAETQDGSRKRKRPTSCGAKEACKFSPISMSDIDSGKFSGLVQSFRTHGFAVIRLDEADATIANSVYELGPNLFTVHANQESLLLNKIDQTG